MQLAGFRRVVATPWSIVDDFSPDVSDRFYELLTSRPGTDSPQALHDAVLEFREKNPDYPTRVWAPYVHIGL
jgi:CHAT domain-containing protein